MPSRATAVFIVLFWLTALGWMGYREWWPWLRADSTPPFTVDLADEAAPQLAHWSIWRGDRKVGTAVTRMTLQKDDTFELQSNVENLDLTVEALAVALRVHSPRITTAQRVTRGGKLLAVQSTMRLQISGIIQPVEVQASMSGDVRDGVLFARGRLTFDQSSAFDEALDPIRLDSDSMLNPLQPASRMHVWPGRRWKTTQVDPFMEALRAAVRQKLGASAASMLSRYSGPRTVLAEVASEPETIEYKGQPVPCHVIRLKSNDFTGRTWVRVADGEVLRQEVSGMGENLTLERED